jgi:hypothetical protein
MPDPDTTPSEENAEETTDGAPAADTAEERPAETAKEAGGGETAGAADAPGKEIGGRGGPDPTRYGDWEINGRCVDF